MLRQKGRLGNDFLRALATSMNGVLYSRKMDMDNGCLSGRADATKQLAGEIQDLLKRVDALPALDTRPEGEILGYGEDGLPF
jgi:hypothetical protein